MGWQRSSSINLDAKPMGRYRTRGESDPEKRTYSDEEEEDDHDDYIRSRVISRSVSAQQRQPILKRVFSGRTHSSIMPRLFRFTIRNICLLIAFTLVLFILSLVRMSYKAGEDVQVAITKEANKPKPAVWEEFPFLTRYYGGVRKLVARKDNVPEYPKDDDEITEKLEDEQTSSTQNAKRRDMMKSIPLMPYPNYESPEYITEYGQKVDCFIDSRQTIAIPPVRVFKGIPEGFPDNVMGSAELVGMRNDICYDRFGRLGPYGLGYSLSKGGSGAAQGGDREGADDVWQDVSEIDFREVKWADVQQRCNAANAHRFKKISSLSCLDKLNATQSRSVAQVAMMINPEDDLMSSIANSKSANSQLSPGKTSVARHVVIIRTWSDYPYTAEDLIYLRSIISELNVLSGGEYSLHFLIQVKDDSIPIFADEETHERVLRDSLPEEFRGMGTLWTERQMLMTYGGLEETWMRDLPVHGVYRSTFMPMQHFAWQHPEFDYFWNWEMDIRTTNHWYHLFDSVAKWARQQPRKLLWERNSRFYIPSEHGSWEDFSHTIRVQTEQGTNSANNIWSGLRAGGKTPGGERVAGDRSIWGPERPLDDDVAFPDDPQPPTSFEKDKNIWGVGEDADLITFNPLFDPDGTTWLLADDTTGYNNTQGRPPRRTAIITASRLSRKLLLNMHKETALKKHTMFSEMWPASCALHHGLKAVYVPHAEYIDRKWPTEYLEKTFNGGRNGATGGARTSVFGDREHNFRGTTWYYNAGFPEVLWHRWLGMKFNNAGGEATEMAEEGRMCLPGMLLHPVKRVELIQEGKRAD